MDRQIVLEEIDRNLPTWQGLPDDLKANMERYCAILFDIAASMRAAGRDGDTTRQAVAGLLQIYEVEITSILRLRA